MALVTGIIILVLLLINIDALIDLGIIYFAGKIIISVFSITCSWSFLHAILIYLVICMIKTFLKN